MGASKSYAFSEQLGAADFRIRPLADKFLYRELVRVNAYMDYCNVLYYGIYDELIRRLQSVQNAAARLVTGTRRSDHISPVLRQLHWLPVRQRVVFKVATLVYQSLCGHAPGYSIPRRRLSASHRCTRQKTAFC